MKNIFTIARAKGASIVLAVSLLATQAHAALPTWAAGAGAEVSERITDMEGMVGPLVVLVTIVGLGFKLFKRLTNKV